MAVTGHGDRAQGPPLPGAMCVCVRARACEVEGIEGRDGVRGSGEWGGTARVSGQWGLRGVGRGRMGQVAAGWAWPSWAKGSSGGVVSFYLFFLVSFPFCFCVFFSFYLFFPALL